MTKPFPAIDFPETIEITLPDASFFIKKKSDPKTVDAANDDLTEVLNDLSNVLGFNGKMTLDTQEKVLNRLLAPFSSAIRNVILHRITALAESRVFTKEQQEELYDFNLNFLSPYILADYRAEASKNAKGYAVQERIKKFYKIPLYFARDLNDFYEKISSTTSATEIVDTICQNIMLFHLGVVLKHFDASGFDRFVEQKLTELVAHLDQKISTLPRAYRLNIGSIFNCRESGEQSPVSIASLKNA